MNCYWIRNSEYELKELRRASEGVAVLPLASIESHGPHLPLGSDILCIRHLLEMVGARETVAILPVLTYSYVAEARMLPGAIHTPSEILTAQVEAICDEVHRNGFEKIVLLHGHGGNTTLHGAFTGRMLECQKPYVVYSVPVFAGAGAQIDKLMETPERGHACEMETSMNLVAAPELVRLERLGAKTFPPEPGPQVDEALTPVNWTAQHPEMAVGEPQKATRQKGEKVFEAWTQAVVATLRQVKRDAVTPEAMRTYNRKAAQPRDNEEGDQG